MDKVFWAIAESTHAPTPPGQPGEEMMMGVS